MVAVEPVDGAPQAIGNTTASARQAQHTPSAQIALHCVLPSAEAQAELRNGHLLIALQRLHDSRWPWRLRALVNSQPRAKLHLANYTCILYHLVHFVNSATSRGIHVAIGTVPAHLPSAPVCGTIPGL